MKKLTKTYDNNDDVRMLIEELFFYNQIKKRRISHDMNMSAQTFNALLNKKNINLADLKRICEVVGYDIEINLIPKEQEQKEQE